MKKAHRGRKDLFFLAKDTAVGLQRMCRQNANKSIRGASVKEGGVKTQVGSNRKGGVQTQRPPPKRKRHGVKMQRNLSHGSVRLCERFLGVNRLIGHF